MNLPLILGVLIAAIGVLYFVQTDGDLSTTEIKIYAENEVVENILAKYKDVIGADYAGYRSHIYRVMTYSMHFLGRDETFLPIIGTALVYHDIGLWTDKTLAYLEPSCSRLKAELPGSYRYSEEEWQLMDDIVYWHHKITPFDGPHADVVEAVRKADWIDATLGLVHQGMPRKHISTVNSAIAENGFHQTLFEFAPRLHGYDVFSYTDLLSILKW